MKRNQARLRLVTVDGEAVGPLRYSQSTSGRRDSRRTTPPDSRSRRTASTSPSLGFLDSALRRYPIVVPHRAAYRDCSAGESDFRYARKASMSAILPIGNEPSIPAGHLPAGIEQYADYMDVQAIRRTRIKMLVDDYGSQTALAEKVGIEPNYISRVLAGSKRVMEDFATRVEDATNKPPGWLSRPLDKPRGEWPFDFDRRHWDSLPVEARDELERSFMRMVMGAEADIAAKHKKRRPA